MKINIQSKGLTEGVRYVQPVKEFSVMSKEESGMVFIIETLQQEVLEGSPTQQAKKAKQLKKIVRGLTVLLAASIQTAPKAFAATAQVAEQTITPALLMKWGTSLALLTVSAGVSLSMIMLAVAGLYRMFRKGDTATAWTSDIIRGLIQTLIAIPAVSLLFYLAQVIFKNLPSLGSLF